MPLRLPEDWVQEDVVLRKQIITKEIKRLYGLQDRWLAEALLKLSRSISKRHSHVNNYETHQASTDLIWRVVPEIARRLGAVNFTAGEINCEIKSMLGIELRHLAGTCLIHSDIASYSYETTGSNPTPEEILGHPIENGNPIIFALDRIAPVNKKDKKYQKDWLARHIRDTAKSRGHRETSHWNPELENPPVQQSAL